MSERSFPHRLGFLGIGAIGHAVIAGLIESGFEDTVLVSERNWLRSSDLSDRFENVAVESDNQTIVDNSDWVFVSVLPEQAREVLMRLNFRREQRLVSMVAGITIDELKMLASPVTRANRIIPLPPIEFGIGPLPVCPSDAEIRSLFENCAVVIDSDDEEQISIFAAASGLMAPHHQLTYTVAQWMTEQGVDPSAAAMYASNMLRALTEIETRTPHDQLAQLAEESTTPGGLNEQALRELRERGWFDDTRERMDRLYDRLRNGM